METPQVVVVAHERLADPSADLNKELRAALGPDGLGLLLIRGVPALQKARDQLLSLAPKLAALGPKVLAELEDPESSYNFGWSCGKESLSNGVPDVAKGSYYANPVLDDPAQGDAELMRQFPAYFRPNVWPSKAHQLPDLEPAFKQLGACVHQAALLLAVHCDKLVAEALPTAQEPPATSIHEVVQQSRNHKARLLHYFPPATIAASRTSSGDIQGAKPDQTPAAGGAGDHSEQPRRHPEGEEQGAGGDDEHDQPWCGWHTDHGSLTGLTCAMYVDGMGRQVPCPDPEAGLYVRTRRGQVVKVSIPPDHLAFQVGEALQVQSGGVLMATPHYVRAVRGVHAKDVSRSTFAAFLQPDVSFVLDAPLGVDEDVVSVGQWRRGQTFGGFSEATLSEYYRDAALGLTEEEQEEEGPEEESGGEDEHQDKEEEEEQHDEQSARVLVKASTSSGSKVHALRQAARKAAAAPGPSTPVKGHGGQVPGSAPGTPGSIDIRSRPSQ